MDWNKAFAARTFDRRAFLSRAAAVSLWAAGRVHGLPGSSPAFRRALSISPFAEMVLQHGITFSDGELKATTVEGIQRLFMAHGSTEVYARIGTRKKFTPGEGDHSVERGLERARLAKKLGLPFNPELGLFAFYGDVTHQPEPDFSDYPQLRPAAPWHELTIGQMTAILREYAVQTATAILSTGVTVNYWDLGNEVERGVAGVAVPPMRQPAGWTYRAPDAVDPEIGKMTLLRYFRMSEDDRIAWLSRYLWPHMGKMFAAVAAGIRSVDKEARFSTHLSGLAAYSPRLLISFFQAMEEAGYRVDQAGLSYYPSSSGAVSDSFASFKSAVSTVAGVLRRPVFVAEYSYPVGPFKFGNDNWDHPARAYPVSRQGQANLTRDMAAWGAATGALSGIRPWAPDLVLPGWGEMSLFDLKDHTAVARPSLDALAHLPGLGPASKAPQAAFD